MFDKQKIFVPAAVLLNKLLQAPYYSCTLFHSLF